MFYSETYLYSFSNSMLSIGSYLYFNIIQEKSNSFKTTCKYLKSWTKKIKNEAGTFCHEEKENIMRATEEVHEK